jgi:hypothetical protein
MDLNGDCVTDLLSYNSASGRAVYFTGFPYAGCLH